MPITSNGSLFIKTTSAASIATSVPAPIAIPTSACARAGASLIPSPTIPTRRPRACISLTFSAFCPGWTSANTFLMPSALATKFAVPWLSPVNIATSMPNAASFSIACLAFGRIESAIAMRPPAVPSTAE